MRKIAVCIKQIPLIEEVSFDPATRTIRRDGPAVISAFDLRAISLALELRAEMGGAETTVVTMGPPQARAALVDALAMGMDRAVHLCDRAFAGSDTLATARTLAAWLKPKNFDLILLGKYTLDAETGQVGPELAELLGLAQITGARKLELDGERIKAERESDEGYEEIETALPALVTCAERIAPPVRIKPGAVDEARQRPVETVTAANLGPAGDFGLKGSPTWVHEVRVLESPKTQCRMIDAGDARQAAERAVAALAEAGALSPREHRRRPIAAAARKPVRGRDIWVACETGLAGNLTRGTLELLSAGDALASRTGGALVAVGFPASIAAHAETLASYGADLVIALDHAELESYAPEIAAEAFARLVRERTPWALLLCASERGRDWGPRLAARLSLGLTGDAIGLDIDDEGRLVALKPAFGGNIVAPIYSRTMPQMATVRAGMLELAEPASGRRAEIETRRPALGGALSRIVRAHSLLDHSVAPLEGAEVVIGVGMGLGGPQAVALARELAQVLNGAMCATRRVTDAGWMPRQLQVGLTGKAIDPRLYFALGIRGAANHLVGIKRATHVVAINNDPEAPIFARATLGLAGDCAVLVPALIEAFRTRLAH